MAAAARPRAAPEARTQMGHARPSRRAARCARPAAAREDVRAVADASAECAAWFPERERARARALANALRQRQGTDMRRTCREGGAGGDEGAPGTLTGGASEQHNRLNAIVTLRAVWVALGGPETAAACSGDPYEAKENACDADAPPPLRPEAPLCGEDACLEVGALAVLEAYAESKAARQAARQSGDATPRIDDLGEYALELACQMRLVSYEGGSAPSLFGMVAERLRGDDVLFDTADAADVADTNAEALAASIKRGAEFRGYARAERREAERRENAERYAWRAARVRFEAKPHRQASEASEGTALFQTEVEEGGGGKGKKTRTMRKGAQARWDASYSRLLAYKLEHGHANPPSKEGTSARGSDSADNGGAQLGPWCAAQRREWRAGRLPLVRYRMLAMVGFNFDPASAAWEARFVELAEHKNEHGTCAPRRPEGARDPSDAAWQLYEWTSQQRVAMRSGTLSHTQRARLQALGLCEDAKQARWEERFTQLKALKTQQGHLDTISPAALSNWAYKQRAAYAEGTLNRDRWRRLNLLGLDWHVRSKDKIPSAPMGASAMMSAVTAMVDGIDVGELRELQQQAGE